MRERQKDQEESEMQKRLLRSGGRDQSEARGERELEEREIKRRVRWEREERRER